MEPALTKMTDEEKARNCHGPHRMYEWTDKDLGTYPSSLPGSFPDVHHNRAKYVVDYPPPTKLREGNVFTSVCLSTGGEYLWSHVLSRRMGFSGPGFLAGGWSGYVQGLSMSRDWVCICRGWVPTSTPLPLTSSGSHYMCGLHMGGTNPTGMLSCIDYATPFHVLICITNFEFCMSKIYVENLSP